MLLENKNAIIYGAGGGIGGGVARTFAREGANVFLAGRTRKSLETVAADITAVGGSAELAEVDALDPRRGLSADGEHRTGRRGDRDVHALPAAEVGPRGVRVVSMCTAGVPETLTREKLASVNPAMEGIDPDFLVERSSEMTMLRRAPRLAQVADAASFLASDRAGAITGTIVNVTCGLVPG
jgi:NAD(P)-dependent dehydrogenase (short-subunit alcohol dehydrogenase family)